MKVVGIIQARMGSTRLPGKILAPIVKETPLLAVLVHRLRDPDIDWWLATSSQRGDDVTAAWGEELGLSVFRGHEEDVLSRFVAIAEETNPDWVVRVTADDPFMDSALVRRMLSVAADLDPDVDVLGDMPPDRQFPLGYVPQVVRGSALLRMVNEIPPGQQHHQTHVTSWLIPDRAQTFVADDLPARPDWRWTVDTPADLVMARAAFSLVEKHWKTVSYEEWVGLLEAEPDILAINANVAQKAVEDG